MFQVNLRAYSQDKMDIFVAEHIYTLYQELIEVKM